MENPSTSLRVNKKAPHPVGRGADERADRAILGAEERLDRGLDLGPEAEVRDAGFRELDGRHGNAVHLGHD